MTTEAPSLVATLRQAASDLMSRASWLRRSGVTFDGKRDYYQAFGYKRLLEPADYRDRYERGDIAATIVEAYPQATWRGEGVLVEDENPETLTAFEDAWSLLDDRLHFWATFERVDILAGLGRFAILLIGAPGEYEQPLERASADDVSFLTPFAEDEVTIDVWDNDTKSRRYGRPIMYQVRRLSALDQKPAVSRSLIGKRVHFSRILHVADKLLDDQVFGQPRLQRVWNRLDDLEKVVGGGAEAFFLRANQGMQVDVDPAVRLTPDGQEKLQDEVDEYLNNMRRMIRTSGVKINSLGSDVANFNAQASSIIDLIAAATGIPQRILMGSERGELASTQDKENWNDRVGDRRTSYAFPYIVQPFTLRLIELGVLPQPTQFNARWPQIQNIDISQRAEIATKWADLNKKAGEVVVTGAEIRDHVLELDPLSPEEIAATTEAIIAARPAPPIAAGFPRAAAAAKPWRVIHQTADAYQDRFIRLMQQAFRAGRKAVPATQLNATLSAHNHTALNDLLKQIEAAFQVELRTLPELLVKVVGAVGEVSANVLRKQLRTNMRQAVERAKPITFTFDKANPRSIDWAKKHAADLVKSISDTTRKQIQEIVVAGFTEGRDLRDVSRDIYDTIGDRTRAELIARTETMTAANEGQRESWDQAVSKGLLSGDERQVWIVTPDDRLCPICEPLDGLESDLGGSFDVEGESFDGPPAHPRCRCVLSLAL